MPRGENRHQRTPQTAELVESLASCGVPQDVIAGLAKLDKKTLTKHYREELDNGGPKAVALMAGKLFAKALNGDLTAMIFWLKANPNARKLGWSERAIVSVEGDPSKPVEHRHTYDIASLPVDQLRALRAIVAPVARGAGPPDSSGGGQGGR